MQHPLAMQQNVSYWGRPWRLHQLQRPAARLSVRRRPVARFSPVCQQQSSGWEPSSSKVGEASTEESSASVQSDGVAPGRLSAESRLAIAAKISAARTLARKLAEEQQASAAATKLKSLQTLSEEEAAELREAAAQSSAEAARELARNDAVARAQRKAEQSAAQLAELERLKAENDALKSLALEITASKDLAQTKVADLKAKYTKLVTQSTVEEDNEEELVRAAAPAATANGREKEITQVLSDLAVARGMVRQQKEAPKPREPEEVRAAREAEARGEAFFVLPAGGVPVGGRGTLLYNRVRGPIPGGAQLIMKMGLNAWEQIEEVPMGRAGGGLGNMQATEWWSVDVKLPDALSSVDFVVVDANSGIVDNNRGRDYSLPLTGALNPQELAERREAEFRAAEDRRLNALDAEEARVRDEVTAEANKQAQLARERFREEREAELAREAEAEVAERRGPMQADTRTEDSRDGLFAWLGGRPRAGSKATLAYNKLKGPLMRTGSVKLHLGFDAWWRRQMKILPMKKLSDQEVQANKLGAGEWYAVEVDVPATAVVLDFVFSDNEEAVWDNNYSQDFHTSVAGSLSGEGLKEKILSARKAASKEEDKKNEDRAAKRAQQKVLAKAAAAKKRREMQRQVLYTLPVFPRAGEDVTIYYNPDATVLRGRPETWMRGSWNRWTHPECFMPTPMEATLPGGVGFLSATVRVPPDAHTMDLVFSDSGDMHGGFYDNNRGLDYHVPITGATQPTARLNIMHLAVEMAPIAKVGGMGDVVTALGRAVQEEGHNVSVVLPKYDCINYNVVENLRYVKDFWYQGVQVKVWEGFVEELRTIFLEPSNGYFWVGCIYGRQDDAHRFYFFCNAALDYFKYHHGEFVHIAHCHDWQTAPIIYSDLGPTRGIFTIHNLNYGATLIGQAMAACRLATTVSPTYATEISGNPAVAPSMGKLYGIRNGIDQDIWDPSEDHFLPMYYSVDEAVEGKAAAKGELRRRMNLSNADVPVVGVVTRLTHQKGIHLIKHAAWRTLERGAQFVLLGSAPDPKVQADFNAMADELGRMYPDRARLWFAYDEPLSHLIYAGADMLLVPSMFEPCGLTQMIAMRYGTIPVVRRTGGLNDTVFDVDHDHERAAASGYETNGYSFEGADPAGLDYALNRALTTWYTDSGFWTMLVKRVMCQDWSWSTPALDYIELYYKALKD